MRDSESGLILRVAVLLVQQTLRCCAAVREPFAFICCHYTHVNFDGTQLSERLYWTGTETAPAVQQLVQQHMLL